MTSNPTSDVGPQNVTELQNCFARLEAKFDNERRERRTEMAQHREKMRIMQEQLNEANNELDLLMTPSFRYRNLGGDEFYYMSLSQYLRVMKKQCNGNQAKLKELEDWEKKARELGTEKVILSSVGAAVVGAVVGLIVVAATHLLEGTELVLGSFLTHTITRVGLACGAKIVAAFACGGLIIFALGYGGVKLYRWYKARDKVERILMENVPENLPNSPNDNHVDNPNNPAEEANNKLSSFISVNVKMGGSSKLLSSA